MESQEVLERNVDVDTSVSASCESEEHVNSVKAIENFNVDELDDMFDDISDRLTVSRMVSDSVIKGMVTAIEREAAEKTAAKESEISSLKQTLHSLYLSGGDMDSSLSSLGDPCVHHDKVQESLHVLRKTVEEQFKRLKKEIEGVRGCSIRGTGSGLELVGLGGILREKESESWVGINKTVDGLEMTISEMYRQVDSVLKFSKTALGEWQEEQDIRGEVEAMVIQSSIRCIQEESEEKMWEKNASFCGSQIVDWNEKFNEISCLRKELDEFIRSLPSPDTGHLFSQGSFDIDSSHGNLSFSTSIQEVNGKANGSINGVPEQFDAPQLNHMSNEELVAYFNTIISKIKREHESALQQLTEKYISLKGKYLSEKRNTIPITKDKDFNTLKKKIPEVIHKLDNILVESEKLPVFVNNADGLGNLKDRLDALLNENRLLRDSLVDKKNEVKCLSSQVSGASEKMLQHSLDQSNLQIMVDRLNSSMADTLIEASVAEEVYKCVLGELSGQIKCMKEESELESTAVQEIYDVLLREATVGAQTTSILVIEDAYMESLFTEGLYRTVFIETLKDAEQQFDNLLKKYLTVRENQVSIEMKALQKEIEEKDVELRLGIEEKERLIKELYSLGREMEEKEGISRQASAALTKEKEQFEIVSKELNDLRNQASLQQILISKSNEELDMINTNLLKAQEQIKVDKVEIRSLSQKLEQAMKEVEEQRNLVFVLAQEKRSVMSLFEAKENEQEKQMEAIIALVDELTKEFTKFECRVTGDITKANTRLKNLSSQRSSLIMAANTLKQTGLLYKQKLEKRSSDLQMAETEVDLLGDEVEALLSLLEKIYVALDHYSPVLKHYPGVTEILELIRRELSGETIKV